MKKRLRKKLFKGEFKELGFYLRFRLHEEISEEHLDAFLDEFLSDAIEANGLEFGGGGGRNEWQGFVALNRRGSVTNEQREAVERWLAEHPKVLDHEIGDLRDAWYDLAPWPQAREAE